MSGLAVEGRQGGVEIKAGLAELDAWIANAETRLTRRFARAMLAQTGVILAAIFGAAIAILRMLG